MPWDSWLLSITWSFNIGLWILLLVWLLVQRARKSRPKEKYINDPHRIQAIELLFMSPLVCPFCTIPVISALAFRSTPITASGPVMEPVILKPCNHKLPSGWLILGDDFGKPRKTPAKGKYVNG